MKILISNDYCLVDAKTGNVLGVDYIPTHDIRLVMMFTLEEAQNQLKIKNSNIECPFNWVIGTVCTRIDYHEEREGNPPDTKAQLNL